MESPDVNIAILPDEDEDEIVRPSAAQRLLGADFESAEKQKVFTVTKQHRDLVYKFRCAIDKYFENPDEEHTFNQAIRMTQIKLKNEKDPVAKFKLIASLVRGGNIYSKTDGLKYLLFHETVISGLNLLSGVHSMLERFRRRAHLLDIRNIEEQIWQYFSITAPPLKTWDAFLDHMTSYFIDTLRLAETGDVNIRQMVEKIFGFGEALVWNGGHINDPNIQFAIKGENGVTIDVDGDGDYVSRWSKADPTSSRTPRSP